MDWQKIRLLKNILYISLTIWAASIVLFFLAALIFNSPDGIYSDSQSNIILLIFLTGVISFIIAIVSFAISKFKKEDKMSTKKNFHKKFNLSNAQFLIILGVIMAGFIFYWFQMRPANIKSECTKSAGEKANELLKTKSELADNIYIKQDLYEAYEKGLNFKDDFKSYYDSCLHSKGL